MAEIKGSGTVQVEFTFTVTEQEARALAALATYGDDAFLNMFYEKLGKAQLKPYEQGMRQFLRSIKGVVCPVLHRADKARKEFAEKI